MKLNQVCIVSQCLLNSYLQIKLNLNIYHKRLSAITKTHNIIVINTTSRKSYHSIYIFVSAYTTSHIPVPVPPIN